MYVLRASTFGATTDEGGGGKIIDRMCIVHLTAKQGSRSELLSTILGMIVGMGMGMVRRRITVAAIMVLGGPW